MLVFMDYIAVFILSLTVVGWVCALIFPELCVRRTRQSASRTRTPQKRGIIYRG